MGKKIHLQVTIPITLLPFRNNTSLSLFFPLQIQHITFTYPRIAQNTSMKYPHKEDTALQILIVENIQGTNSKMLHEYHTQIVLKTNCAKSADVL